MKCTTTAAFALSLAMSLVAVAAPARAAGPDQGSNSESICDGPSTRYSYSNVRVSVRPTNVKSAYVTGPATIAYNKTISASVGASMTGTVSAEAGVVLAKASTSIGVSVTGSRTWTDGFTYTLTVPSGQRRAMQLFQESRAFTVTKQSLRYPCTYVTVYSGQNVNAPRTSRIDEWKLVS